IRIGHEVVEECLAFIGTKLKSVGMVAQRQSMLGKNFSSSVKDTHRVANMLKRELVTFMWNPKTHDILRTKRFGLRNGRHRVLPQLFEVGADTHDADVPVLEHPLEFFKGNAIRSPTFNLSDTPGLHLIERTRDVDFQLMPQAIQ